MTEAEKIYHRFVNYEWNKVSNSLKGSILEAINEALRQNKKYYIETTPHKLKPASPEVAKKNKN